MDIVTGQRFAQLCGANWNDTVLGAGPLIYCVTHEVLRQFRGARHARPVRARYAQ